MLLSLMNLDHQTELPCNQTLSSIQRMPKKISFAAKSSLLSLVRWSGDSGISFFLSRTSAASAGNMSSFEVQTENKPKY